MSCELNIFCPGRIGDEKGLHASACMFFAILMAAQPEAFICHDHIPLGAGQKGWLHLGSRGTTGC